MHVSACSKLGCMYAMSAMRCSNCGKDGHDIETCRLVIADMRCHNCGVDGHGFKNCGVKELLPFKHLDMDRKMRHKYKNHQKERKIQRSYMHHFNMLEEEQKRNGVDISVCESAGDRAEDVTVSDS